MAGFTKNQIIGIGRTSQRVRDQLIARLMENGIANREVLAVMSKMPRHLFVDEAMQEQAYQDNALPIGHGQTISQPFIVARMTEEILKQQPKPKKVLEVGTGSAYQAAILGALIDRVYTVERIKELYLRSKNILAKMKFENIHCAHSDGSWGLEQFAPFDAILVACAAAEVPQSLLMQLKIGGSLIIPVGKSQQQLNLIRRLGESDFESELLEQVQFVPLVKGEA